MSFDLSIGRGDNAPPPTWTMPFAVAGSDFALVVTSPAVMARQPPSVMTLTASGGDLKLDPVANTVTWPITAAQSAALSYINFYTLRRTVPGGEVRYYAQGRIFGVDGPVGPSSVAVAGVGPQGVIGSPGASAYDLAGGDAKWGSLAAWLASLAQGGVAEQDYPISVAAGQTVLPLSPPPTLLSSLVLVVNGVEYRSPLSLSASTVAVTWEGPFPLAPADDIHVRYF